jgi:hypothetical protein
MEAAESNEREVEKGIAARGKAGEGREARLNKREAGMGAQKNELQGLALLEAGLAIMSTPGKLAEAVGKGAQAGLRTYSAGVKDLRAAQEKLDDARDQLEELRRNEDNMTAKERREARQGVKAAQVKGKELGLQAAEKMYGYKRADANAIFAVESQGLLTDKEIQGRKDVAAMQERGANARAAQLPKEMQIAMALGTGKTDAERLESGMRRMQEVQAGKFSVTNSYADYLKAFAGKDTLTPPLSFADYAAKFGAVLPR